MSATDRLRVVFMGSPDFAVPTLRALVSAHEVVGVVTQPDRPRGRGRGLAPPPVKIAASEYGLSVFQPERLRRRAAREAIMALRPDVVIVVAYGQILSKRFLTGPPMGCINVHASLLPRLRGAAPIQWAVLRGETRTGVTIMQMDSGIDTGPTLLSKAISVEPTDTAGSLHDKLAVLGPPLLLDALAGLRCGALQASAQDDAGATEAPMLRKTDALVDFCWSAAKVDRWIRGMDPWPAAFTTLSTEPLRLFNSFVASERESGGRPGEILAIDARGMLVRCGDGAVCIASVQRAGGRRISAKALRDGRKLDLGAVLGA